MYVLRTVAVVVRLDRCASGLLLLSDLHSRELRCKDYFISYAPLCHPLANPLLALAELVVDRRIDPVASLLIEVVKNLEGCLFRAFAN